MNIGSGYRVYYAQSGKTVLLLLCGGTKKHKTLISLAHVLAGGIGKTVKIKGVRE